MAVTVTGTGYGNQVTANSSGSDSNYVVPADATLAIFACTGYFGAAGAKLTALSFGGLSGQSDIPGTEIATIPTSSNVNLSLAVYRCLIPAGMRGTTQRLSWTISGAGVTNYGSIGVIWIKGCHATTPIRSFDPQIGAAPYSAAQNVVTDAFATAAGDLAVVLGGSYSSTVPAVVAVAGQSPYYTRSQSGGGLSIGHKAIASGTTTTVEADYSATSSFPAVIGVAIRALAFALIGSVTVNPVVSGTMEFQRHTSIAGSVSVTPDVSSTLQYQRHPSILGGITVEAAVASATAFNQSSNQQHYAVIGNVTVGTVIESTTAFSHAYNSIYGWVWVGVTPGAIMLHTPGHVHPSLPPGVYAAGATRAYTWRTGNAVPNPRRTGSAESPSRRFAQ